MKVVGIDPGKKGFDCLLDGSSPPVFTPAPVTDPDDEDKVRYDLTAMVERTARWARQGVLLVVLELQAPRRHGTGKFGQGKEGTVSSWTNGFGFGCWETSLVAAGFKEAIYGTIRATFGNWYVKVDPRAWKTRMGVIASHRGEDSPYARKKANDERSIQAAKLVDPSVDYRATERSPGARVDCTDKAVARLLAEFGRKAVIIEGGAS